MSEPSKRQGLIEDLQRVASIVDGQPTAAEYREHGEHSLSPLISQFGSWNGALKEANLETNFEYDSSNHGASKKELLEEIRRVAEVVDGSPTFDEFKDLGGFSPHTYYANFDSFVEAKTEAGVGEYEREPDLKTAKCDWCGTELHRYKSQIQEHNFCDGNCHNEWQRENRGGENDPQWNRVEVDCANCGATHLRKPSRVKKYDKQFCDLKCQSEWQSKHKTGERNYNYNQVEVDCAWCGDTVSFPKSRIEKSDNIFCEMECRAEWLSENAAGKKNPNYVERVEVECEMCGKTLHRVPSRAKQNGKHFCDRACKGAWRSEHKRGKNHSRWKGGYEPYYGANWREQRRKRLELDGYECVVCGMSQEEHMGEYATGLHVHHITPLREFRQDGDLDAEAANDLENLRSMCIAHHRKWEGVPVAPDREK